MATGKPMRARIKGSWEVEGRVRREAQWTAAGGSSPAPAIQDRVAQMAWEQTAAGVAEGIASVTAAFPLEADQGAGALSVAAPGE